MSKNRKKHQWDKLKAEEGLYIHSNPKKLEGVILMCICDNEIDYLNSEEWDPNHISAIILEETDNTVKALEENENIELIVPCFLISSDDFMKLKNLLSILALNAVCQINPLASSFGGKSIINISISIFTLYLF